ncbi:MAG: hypothetical protein JNK48_22365 [Bryobacterales bacterium]|nr:hypothetical protein [Bryobacterales bacterium]
MAQSNPALSPVISTHPQGDPLRISTVFSFAVARSFADGFFGGILGGLLYCIALSYLYPAGLDQAWMRVATISLTLGGFETWRVRRLRPQRSVRTCLIWTLSGCLLLLWVIEAVASAAHRSHRVTPPNIPQSPVVFVMVSRLPGHFLVN